MKIIALIPALLLIGAAPPQAPAPLKVVPMPLKDAPPEILEKIAGRPILPQDECRTIHEADPDETARVQAMPLTEAKGGQLYLPVLRYDEDGCLDPLIVSNQRFGR